MRFEYEGKRETEGNEEMFEFPCPIEEQEVEQQPQTYNEWKDFVDNDWVLPNEDLSKLVILPIVSMHRGGDGDGDGGMGLLQVVDVLRQWMNDFLQMPC